MDDLNRPLGGFPQPGQMFPRVRQWRRPSPFMPGGNMPAPPLPTGPAGPLPPQPTSPIQLNPEGPNQPGFPTNQPRPGPAGGGEAARYSLQERIRRAKERGQRRFLQPTAGQPTGQPEQSTGPQNTNLDRSFVTNY